MLERSYPSGPFIALAEGRAGALQLELDQLASRRTELIQELASLGVTERATAAVPAAAVLVVHRDESLRQAAAMALAAAGHEVGTAIDGRSALLRLDEGAADLVIAEATMTDLAAFELVAAMQQRPALEHIPLILLGPAEAMGDVALALGRVPFVAGFDPAELVARVGAAIARAALPLPAEPLVPVLSPPAFDRACSRELLRSVGVEGGAVLAIMRIFERDGIRSHLGRRADRELSRQLGLVLTRRLGLLDAASLALDGSFAILLADAGSAPERIDGVIRAMVGRPFYVGGRELRVTPGVGYVFLRDAATVPLARRRAGAAAALALSRNDIEPVAYSPELAITAGNASARARVTLVDRLWDLLRTPVQIAITLLVGAVLPFVLYVLLAGAGLDITPVMYVVVVVALVSAAALIIAEGFAALRPVGPPPFAGEYPAATAIVAAYLPNEAATILETVAAFLRLDYPGGLQIILAYNTPRDLPVEALLRSTARRDPRLQLLRVGSSTSKAQNVNAALDLVTGRFIGVFDADHHPDPQSFQRAWAWLAGGFDVVQGHNVIRNGDASGVARTVAVEFESTYAVGHPGRNRLHGFGIFGGSNGYWITDLLRQTRLRGTMLTEDIDSSMRVLETGHRIASDPSLISRELAPTTLAALWHQRSRWAQGWHQVSLRHTLRGLRSPTLTLRHKLGLIHLLAWREMYPWFSIQIFPIVAFWLLAERRTLDWFVPILVVATVFTLSVGPLQSIFAYLLAEPSIRRRWGWFLLYFLASSLFYTELKNMITRVAQLKELMRERAWRVTPRSG